MPDITMCLSNACPRKELCYRAQVTPNPYGQSYADLNKDCKTNNYRNYIKVEERSNKLPRHEVL